MKTTRRDSARETDNLTRPTPPPSPPPSSPPPPSPRLSPFSSRRGETGEGSAFPEATPRVERSALLERPPPRPSTCSVRRSHRPTARLSWPPPRAPSASPQACSRRSRAPRPPPPAPPCWFPSTSRTPSFRPPRRRGRPPRREQIDASTGHAVGPRAIESIGRADRDRGARSTGGETTRVAATFGPSRVSRGDEDGDVASFREVSNRSLKRARREPRGDPQG